MKYKKLGPIILVVVLSFYLGGCENPFNSSANKKTQIKASKENNIQNVNKLNKVEISQKNEELLQSKINDYLVGNGLSGSVFMARDNKVLFNGSVGYANVEKKLLNQPSTTYPIGSITKIFVATSIMKLQEEHKLNIQDPVSKYISNFPNGNKIKLYNLLTHTSGLQRPHWKNGDSTPLSLIQDIEKVPLKFQPGEKWDYEDINYMVLGYILEKVSKTSLHQFIKENIIDKAQLKETGFITHEHPVPYTSVGYLSKNNTVQRTEYLNTDLLYACGDIYSTASDLAKFDKALMSGKLVSKNSLIQMLTSSPRSSYGLGLYIKGDEALSNGVLGGWLTTHSYFKDNTQIVVLLNNNNNSIHIDKISLAIYQIVKESQNQEIPKQ